ncbi:MAG: hypothetical protein RIQ93_891 [Verrucomicrobiota bacterium]|jgi:hypothetical protein
MGGAVGTVTVRAAVFAVQNGWGAGAGPVAGWEPTLLTAGLAPNPLASERGPTPITRGVSTIGWGPIKGVPGETVCERGGVVVGVVPTGAEPAAPARSVWGGVAATPGEDGAEFAAPVGERLWALMAPGLGVEGLVAGALAPLACDAPEAAAAPLAEADPAELPAAPAPPAPPCASMGTMRRPLHRLLSVQSDFVFMAGREGGVAFRFARFPEPESDGAPYATDPAPARLFKVRWRPSALFSCARWRTVVGVTAQIPAGAREGERIAFPVLALFTRLCGHCAAA